MKTRLLAAPWVRKEMTQEAAEAVAIIADNVWRDASISFSAEREAREKAGLSAPKGMQKYLNQVLSEKFSRKGWIGYAGYYYKNKTWVRITFRHQMSLGSDILDAIKVCKKNGMEMALILAANKNTLGLISPNDAGAMVSFEKLEREVMDLTGALNDVPLVIGELSQYTSASEYINEGLKKARPRDVTVPKRR